MKSSHYVGRMLIGALGPSAASDISQGMSQFTLYSSEEYLPTRVGPWRRRGCCWRPGRPNQVPHDGARCAARTPAADAMRATAWRSALFMLGIHAPRATAELLDVTLTRQWDGGLLGFVLEQSEIGQLIAEVSPGMAADVDESLQPGDVIIGAEGLAEGLFDQASLHECRVLDALPPGTALSSTWHRRG